MLLESGLSHLNYKVVCNVDKYSLSVDNSWKTHNNQNKWKLNIIAYLRVKLRYC